MKRAVPLRTFKPLKSGGVRLRQGRSTGKPTKAEAKRFDALGQVGCICCYLNRKRGMPTAYFGIDVHHLLSGGRRRGHAETLACCPWHHRGVKPYESMTDEQATRHFGPSLAHGSKPFHAGYGTDDELLALQEQLINGERA